MGGEDGGNIDTALLTERDCDTCQPLVELNNNGSLLFMVDVLRNCQCSSWTMYVLSTYLA